MDFIDTIPDWPYSRAKTAVIRAAAAVIRESGPRSATLKNIAQKAGITEPAIFRHFDGVDGLFEGLFFLFESSISQITACYDRPQKGFDRVIGATSSAVQLLAQNKDFTYLVLNAEHVFRGYENLRKRVMELRNADTAASIAAFEEAASMGQLRKETIPSFAAMSIMSILYYTLQSWVESDVDLDVVNHAVSSIKELATMFMIS